MRASELAGHVRKLGEALVDQAEGLLNLTDLVIRLNELNAEHDKRITAIEKKLS